VYEPDRHDVEERDAIFERYVRLTREAAERDPDLVIWPESAVPGAIPSDTGAVGILFRLAHELQTPLLVAAGGRDKSAPETAIAQVANSAFLIDPEPAIRTRYDKVRLLPFNEYLPLRSWIPWPSWISPGKLRDAVAGTAAPSFETAGRRYRVQICWESLFPADAGAFADVDFLVTLTNEAFTDTRAGYEHLLAMNAFRAVETGVPVVRATTTSISAVIAPDGSIVQRLGSDAGGELYGVLVADLPPAASRPTLYARLGGLLAPSLLIAGLGGLVVTRRSHIAPGRLP
jgi:apolipoprotein N-acyltransferase